MKKAILYTDGASLGNPGKSGAGVVLQVEGQLNLPKISSKYLGIMTNNQAEYEALILGLKKAKAMQIKELRCFSDSELMVKQLNGEYRINNEIIGKKFIEVWNLRIGFHKIKFIHTKRDGNKQADFLAKKGAMSRI